MWGVGEKAKLTANILQTEKIPFRWMVMNPKKYPNGIQSKTVVDFKNISNLKDPQLLIAIYPERNVRLKIEAYLHSCRLEEGKSFWYL